MTPGARHTVAAYVASKTRTNPATLSVAGRVDGKILARLDIVTVSEANAHTHRRARQKRAKAQRGLAALVIGQQRPRPPCTVTMTRVSTMQLDDDNLAGALKHIRDGIADAMGINDRDKRVTWKCEQKKGARGERAVEIEIVEREP